MYLVIRATGGIRLTACGPVLVQQPAAAGGVRLVGRARARLDEVVSVELVVLHSVGPVRVAVVDVVVVVVVVAHVCLLYTSPSPRDYAASRMPSSA